MALNIEELKLRFRKISIAVQVGPQSNPWEMMIRGLVMDFIIEHLFGMVMTRGLSINQMAGTFLWSKDNNILYPYDWIFPEYSEPFGSSPALQSLIDLEDHSNLVAFLELRRLWLNGDWDEIFENESYTPWVQSEDYGSPSGGLYVVPHRINFFQNKKMWYLGGLPPSLKVPVLPIFRTT